MHRSLFLTLALALIAVPARASDWPTVHRDAARSGFTPDTVRPPYALQWAAEFPGEVLATRVEAIVAGGSVFTGTYSGNLYALDRETGKVRWRHSGGAPVLHSPAAAGSSVFYGTAGLDGALFGLDAATGRQRWRFPVRGGFAASPLVARETVFIGGRDGVFYGVDARTGRERFRYRTGGPVRNTAALAGERVLFASDDMRAYCLDARSGRLLWKSAPLFGQSFRDYYPVVLGDRVLFRSVLVEEMNDDLNGGTQFLQRQAGIPGGWKELDRFFKSDAGRGTPELLRREQEAIRRRLEENPYRRTCFLLDLETGRETVRAPVMYAAGNQGAGFPPALTREGKPLLFYRTVYGNWSHGVKPAVGIGFLDPFSGWIEPLRHNRGNTPPWNTFWGTSDESTTFSVGGDLLYLCHQGTLAALDLKTRDLFTVHGERDTWGGLLAPIWAANEWHGPARGSCAISDDQLFWVTGSRVLAVRGNGKPGAPAARPVPAAEVPEPVRFAAGAGAEVLRPELVPAVTAIPDGKVRRLRETLRKEVRELREGWPWAPAYLQIGIGSRDFMFAHASELVETLALVLPYVEGEDRRWAREQARTLLPGCLDEGELSLKEGRRRELYPVPPHDLSWARHPGWPPLSHLHALWLYASRTGDWKSIAPLLPRCRRLWEGFRSRPLHVSDRPESLYRNRTLSGLVAYSRMLRRLEGEGASAPVDAECRRLFGEILADYRAKARQAATALRRKASKGDIHANQARFLYLGLHNHKSKLALFKDLTPELARALREAAPEETEALRRAVALWMPAYYLAFEERQVHYGENFIDLPDSVHGLYQARALLWQEPAATVARETDLRWFRGDLYHLQKLVTAIERHGTLRWHPLPPAPAPHSLSRSPFRPLSHSSQPSLPAHPQPATKVYTSSPGIPSRPKATRPVPNALASRSVSLRVSSCVLLCRENTRSTDHASSLEVCAPFRQLLRLLGPGVPAGRPVHPPRLRARI